MFKLVHTCTARVCIPQMMALVLLWTIGLKEAAALADISLEGTLPNWGAVEDDSLLEGRGDSWKGRPRRNKSQESPFVKLIQAPGVSRLFYTSWPPGSRKLAVVNSTSECLGTGVLPRAIPTIAVMWVSGPNTWRGIPRLWPTSRRRLHTLDRSQVQVLNS